MGISRRTALEALHRFYHGINKDESCQMQREYEVRGLL